MSYLNRIKKVILATLLAVLCPLSLVYASDYHGIYEVDDSVVTSLEVIVMNKTFLRLLLVVQIMMRKLILILSRIYILLLIIVTVYLEL